MRVLFAMLTAMVLMSAAAPASAAEGGVAAPVNPYLASGLSAWLPALGLPLALVHPVIGLGFSAASYGTGQLYAGDPQRGGLVALGGAAVLGTGSYLVYQSAASQGPWDSGSGVISTAILVGISAVLYGQWAGQDAYEAAVRRNMALSNWRAPLAPPYPERPSNRVY